MNIPTKPMPSVARRGERVRSSKEEKSRGWEIDVRPRFELKAKKKRARGVKQRPEFQSISEAEGVRLDLGGRVIN